MRANSYSNLNLSPAMKGRNISPDECTRLIRETKVPYSKEIKKEVLGFIDKRINTIADNPNEPYSYMFDIVYPMHYVIKLARTGHKKASRMLETFRRNPKFNEDIKIAATTFEENVQRSANNIQRREALAMKNHAKKLTLNISG